MNSLQLTHRSKTSSHRSPSSRRSPKRGIVMMAATLLLISAGAFAWHRSSNAAAAPSSLQATGLWRRVSPSLPAALNSNRRPVASAAAAGKATISTIVGGGFGSDVPAKQAPVVQPTGVALDPQNRGFYVMDEVNSTTLLRFVNTSASPVTLAGVTIQPGDINLIAGGGTQVTDDTPPRDLDLGVATGLAVDPSGNAVYLVTPVVNAIRAINVSTQNVTILNKTIAPSGVKSVFESVNISDPRAVAVDPATHNLYFIGGALSPLTGRVVYQVSGAGVATPYAGGGNQAIPDPAQPAINGTDAKIVTPMGLVVDNSGNLLIAQGGDTRSGGAPGAVLKVDTAAKIKILALGLAKDPQHPGFDIDTTFPTGIALGPDGNVYVALGNSQQIARVSPSGAKTTVAGNNSFIVCNTSANPTCGDGGNATSASFILPGSTDNKNLVLAADASGVFIPDFGFRRVRYANLKTSSVTIASTIVAGGKIDTVVGSGFPSPFDNVPATAAELFAPTGVAADAQGNLYVADSGNNRVRFVNRGASSITLFAGTPSEQTVKAGQIVSLNKDLGGDIVDDRIATAVFASPQGLAVTSNGVFIVDAQNGTKFPAGSLSGKRTGLVRFLNTSSSPVTLFSGAATVTAAPGEVKIVAGIIQGTKPENVPSGINDGAPSNNSIIFPTDVAVDGSGNIYIADQGNNRVRKINASTGIISTFYGDGSTTLLSGPAGIGLDSTGRLHIADTKHDRVLRQDAPNAATFSIIADSSKGISKPRDVVVDASGNVYVTNTGAGANKVLKITAPDNTLGTVMAVAGTGPSGFAGDGGDALLAKLNLPNPGSADIVVTTNIIRLLNGDLVFTDTVNNRVRLIAQSNNQPPALAALTNQTMNEGASLTVNLSASDPNGDSLTFSVTNKPSFATLNNTGPGTANLVFSPGFSDSGTYNITVTVSDGELTDNKSFTLTVNNVNRPPTATANPIASPVEATSFSGASVHLVGSGSDPDNDPLTFKWFDGANQIASTAVADVTLGLGTHSITLMVTDSAGASASSTAQSVVVRDTTPPTITGTSNITVQTASASGATVTYPTPTATDLVSGSVQVTCTPPSGSVFPVGTTTVNCTAKDGSNNTATASFTVTVNRTQTPPANITLAYNGKVRDRVGKGALALTPDGTLDATFTVTLQPSSGNRVVTALDLTGSTGGGRWVAIANNTQFFALGAASSFDAALFNSASNVVNFPVAAGGTFALFASDNGTNLFAGGTIFTLTVSFADSTTATATATVPADTNHPPVANAKALPATIEATSAAGAAVMLDGTGSSDQDNDPLSFAWKDNGNQIATTATANVTLGLGNHSITLTVSDGKGGVTTSAAQTVVVQDTTPPTINNVPANINANATSASGAAVNYAMPTATDVVDGSVTVTADKPSGSTFPLGTTTVTFTAKDSHNNTATKTFTVTVQNNSGGPVFSGVPADLTVEATGPNGAAVNYSLPTATDPILGSVQVSPSKAPGSVFPLGVTVVTFTATSSGKTSMASFKVTVQDTTPPVFGPAPDVTSDAASDSGANVSYTTPTAADLVDGQVTVTCTPPSGSLFPKGVTAVTCTAKDSRNNKATKTFNVTVSDVPTYIISTVAGSGTYGYCGDGSVATAACFRQVTAMAVDDAGNLLLADANSHNVRRVDAQTGVITTIANASSGGGISGSLSSSSSGSAFNGRPPADSGFASPAGVAVDAAGNIYISDSSLNRVRILTTDGKISHFAGDASGVAGSGGDNGPAASARLNRPTRLAVDAQNNLYIADSGNNRVRMVDAKTKIIVTVAGNGGVGFGADNVPATLSSLNNPMGLAVDLQGNLFIADVGSFRIREVLAATGFIITVAGNGAPGFGDDGPATQALLNNATGVAVDARGNLFIADQGNNRIRRVASATGKITTVAGQGLAGFSGDGKKATLALLTAPMDVAVDKSDVVYLADSGNLRGRRLKAGSSSNTPPVACLSPLSAFVSAADATGATVHLDGSCSSDVDEDPLTFTWTDNGAVIANTAVADVTLSLGTHSIMLTVKDGRGGENSTAPQSVTVNPPGLKIDSISPNTIVRGDIVVVTITGSGFVPESVVSVSGSGISVKTKFISSTQLSVTVSVSSGAFTITRAVTVTNPGGASVTVTSGLQIRRGIQ